MLLVIDVGNTQTVIGLLDDGAIVADWRLATVRHRTADELAGLLQGFFSLLGERLRDTVDAMAVASVVPRLTAQWVTMGEKHLGLTPFVVGPGIRTGMRLLLKNPTEVGADRIANAVAGLEAYGAPVIVVDFGTSTNFDVVNADGDYVGGSIAPGVEVSMEALTTRAARLTKVDITEPAHAIGRDTLEAMQSGAVYGFAGQVDGIAEAIRVELGTEAPVVATGGLASLIAPHSRTISVVDPTLTLRGIELIMRRQVAH
ncbi:MAG TPA: type III pantothenate kinase [Thermoleophilia bacterium]|nr:type III pantothenate kinase [Thermoleophilia bacterium]